jgi:hypothetical protein
MGFAKCAIWNVIIKQGDAWAIHYFSCPFTFPSAEMVLKKKRAFIKGKMLYVDCDAAKG